MVVPMNEETDGLGLPLKEEDKSAYEKKTGWLTGSLDWAEDAEILWEQLSVDELERWWTDNKETIKTLKPHHQERLRKNWGKLLKSLREQFY